MTETNEKQYADLDQMRIQMQDLKRSLDNQKLVNQRLMRQVMASKSVFIRRYTRFQLYILLPFIFLIFLLVKEQNGMSWLLYTVTVVMCSVSIGIDTYINRMSEDDYASMPLLELMSSLVRRRKNRRIQMAVGLPVVALWLVWYIVEIYGIEKFGNGGWIGCVIGGVIGGFIGFKITNRAQQIDMDAIKNIRQMMDED